jgi:hypothetical protein
MVFVDLASRQLMMLASTGFGPREIDRNLGRTFRLGSQADGDVFDYDLAAAGEVIETYGLQQDGKGVIAPETARKYDLDSLLAHPLRSGKGLRGYICHFGSGSDPFTQEQRRMLANQALLALEILEKDSDLDPLLEMSETLSQGLLLAPPGEYLPQIARRACELLSVPICIVWLVDENRQRLRVAASAMLMMSLGGSCWILMTSEFRSTSRVAE